MASHTAVCLHQAAGRVTRRAIQRLAHAHEMTAGGASPDAPDPPRASAVEAAAITGELVHWGEPSVALEHFSNDAVFSLQ
jgi:hypothetical protein